MIKTVLTILLIVICALIVVVVMLQHGSEKGLGAISGISSQDTYWGKNKGRSTEGRLKKLTAFLVVAVLGLSLLLNSSFINGLSSKNDTGESVKTTSTSATSTGSDSVVSDSNSVISSSIVSGSVVTGSNSVK